MDGEASQPQALEKTAYILHLKDYLFYKLTGKITTDATDQSALLIFLNQGSTPVRAGDV